MKRDTQLASLQKHLTVLVDEIGERTSGSESNRRADAYVLRQLQSCGLEVETQPFDVIDWQCLEAQLPIAGEAIPVFASQYSRPCYVTAPIALITKVEELEHAELRGKIALLYGDFIKDTIMPKRFRFYNPEEHQKLNALLEAKQPEAVVTVSSRVDRAVGAFVDADLIVPSAYVSFQEEAVVRRWNGKLATLRLDTLRNATQSQTIIGQKVGKQPTKITLCAHLDTTFGTPGAIDDGTGIAILLTLAEWLQGVSTEHTIEWLFFNSEDSGGAEGEMLYDDDFDVNTNGLQLLINVDGVGLKGYAPSVCSLNLDNKQQQRLEKVIANARSIVTEEPWYQGDHSIFAFRGVPCIVFSSERIFSQVYTIPHTEHDTIEQLDFDSIQSVTTTIYELIQIW
ncbi:MAG: M28 family metallopeptidase [bacterium]|nr:M28 family metallopeptidase [bacterium]